MVAGTSTDRDQKEWYRMSLNSTERGYSGVAVSVIVPLFDGESFIRSALESVRRQTVEDWEVIVVDDGSTDAGATIVEELGTIDRRIRLIRKANGGVSAARNDALRESRGQFIAFLDSDDFWRSSHLESLLSELTFGGCDIAVGDAVVYDDAARQVVRGRIPSQIQKREFPESLGWANFIVPSMVVMRRGVVDAIGFFDETPAIQHAEDWDFWLRGVAAGMRFGFDENISVYYRKHAAAASRKRLMLQRRTVAMLKRHEPTPGHSREAWMRTMDRRRWLVAAHLVKDSPQRALATLRAMSIRPRLRTLIELAVLLDAHGCGNLARGLLSIALHLYLRARKDVGRLLTLKLFERADPSLQWEAEEILREERCTGEGWFR